MQKEVYQSAIGEGLEALGTGVKVITGGLNVLDQLTDEYRKGLMAEGRTDINQAKAERFVKRQLRRRAR